MAGGGGQGVGLLARRACQPGTGSAEARRAGAEKEKRTHVDGFLLMTESVWSGRPQILLRPANYRNNIGVT